MSDVSFTCGESSRIFHAHKYVLSTSSAVFFAMFYGNLVQKESTITIPDAHEESFVEFLRYLYTDNCKITAENAIGVMYLAKKYLIPSLAQKFCKVIEKSIKPDVFMVLEQAIQFDEKKLEALGYRFVENSGMYKFGRVLQYRITNIERFVKEGNADSSRSGIVQSSIEMGRLRMCETGYKY